MGLGLEELALEEVDKAACGRFVGGQNGIHEGLRVGAVAVGFDDNAEEPEKVGVGVLQRIDVIVELTQDGLC